MQQDVDAEWHIPRACLPQRSCCNRPLRNAAENGSQRLPELLFHDGKCLQALVDRSAV